MADLPDEVLQDPTFLRSGGAQKGRDGCRVPLPWSSQGPTLGFGDELAHLPVPADFDRFAVENQAADDESTLAFYRRALSARRRLLDGETLEWLTPRAGGGRRVHAGPAAGCRSPTSGARRCRCRRDG